MRKILNYFGFFLKDENSYPYSYDYRDYTNVDSVKSILHKELLTSIEEKEDIRLGIIDTKTSQLITYTGIIFSGLSLFIPILLSKTSGQGLCIRVALLVLLALAFLFYFLTINNAIRNYDIGKFVYSSSHPNNVIKYQLNSVEEFTSIEIRDLLFSINQNLKSNNEKANNLIYAYRAFKIANVMTALLGLLLCFVLLFSRGKQNDAFFLKNEIENRDANKAHDIVFAANVLDNCSEGKILIQNIIFYKNLER